MKFLIVFFYTLFSLKASAQKIVNLVFVGDKGVTENIKEAKFFIVVKDFGGKLQRLDYKMSGPIIKESNYLDSNMQILDGPYYEYALDGSLAVAGTYINDLKEYDWMSYNDTGKVILIKTYLNNALIKTTDPDTVAKKEILTVIKVIEKEADFGKNNKAWKNFLVKNLNAEVGNQSVNGGTVRVGFIVDTIGKCIDIHVKKSIEFVLDEEVKRIIYLSPTWIPAEQAGKKVKAYRIQPITFVKS